MEAARVLGLHPGESGGVAWCGTLGCPSPPGGPEARAGEGSTGNCWLPGRLQPVGAYSAQGGCETSHTAPPITIGTVSEWAWVLSICWTQRRRVTWARAPSSCMTKAG